MNSKEERARLLRGVSGLGAKQLAGTESPSLIRLKELEVLREIGMRGGNSFYIGMDKLGMRGPESKS